MKRLLYPILLLLFAITTQAQNIPSYVPTNGLVGWWPFNGNANDESGNGNHGTVNGATLTSDRNGVQGKAYFFDYFDEITTGFNLISGSQPRTFSFWLKNKNSSKTITPIWYGGSNTPYPGHTFNIRMNRNEQHDQCGCWPTIYQGAGIDGAWMNLIYQSTIGDNLWHNYIYVVDGTSPKFNQVKIYKDGVLISTPSNINFDYNSNSSTLINTSNATPLKFGRSMANQGFPNDLLDRSATEFLDDIAIYNRSLTQSEISALYTGNPPCTPTSSNFNLTIPSTSLPYTWNGLTFNSSGSQTAHLTNASGCDSAASLNLTVNYNIPNYVPTNGLVGWWPFNGNANDESGNGNHGVNNNSVISEDRFGIINF